MPTPKPPVPLRAYELTATPLPFSRNTFYRWERIGVIPRMLRLGGKTLLQATTVEAILAGEITMPRNAGMVKPPQPLDRGGHAKRGHAVAKPKPKPKPEPAAAE
jgi:hypothetical protein